MPERESFQSTQPPIGPWKSKLVPETVPNTTVFNSPDIREEYKMYEEQKKQIITIPQKSN
jgi:hypothetical protein